MSAKTILPRPAFRDNSPEENTPCWRSTPIPAPSPGSATWEESAAIIAELLYSSDGATRLFACKELLRMGRILDRRRRFMQFAALANLEMRLSAEQAHSSFTAAAASLECEEEDDPPTPWPAG